MNQLKSRKGILYSALIFISALIIVSIFYFSTLLVGATDTTEMTNVVIFVKMAGDSNDTFNNLYYDAQTNKTIAENWQKIKKMYNGGTASNGYDNSFSAYIYAVSEGRYSVNNYFPQVYTDADGVERINTYILSQSSYSTDSEIVTEVISAINSNVINISSLSGAKLDNANSNILDNLTILVQGDNINGVDRSFHAEYGGSECINGMNVRDYIMIPSKALVGTDSNAVVTGQQAVIAHEFLHTLGLQDLYYESGSGSPVGTWDIMGSAYVIPSYPLEYVRRQAGWIGDGDCQIINASSNDSGDYTITAPTIAGGTKLIMIKTPLGESSSETICLEYRYKKSYTGQFDTYIPSTGLIMYRVNDAVEYQTNVAGQNYIYIYRPGETSLSGASADTYSAGLNPENQRTEYGSTSLDDSYTSNTLFYSDGKNSGIKISNVSISADYSSVSFHIEYADYSQAVLSEDIGGSVANNVWGDPSFTIDQTTGDKYVAYTYQDGSNIKLCAKKYNASTNGWDQVGSSINIGSTCSSFPSILAKNGNIYLAYANGGLGNPVVVQYSNGDWSSIYTPAGNYVNSIKLFSEGDNIYLGYTKSTDSNINLVICNVNSQSIITDNLATNASFCNPDYICWKGKFYVACAEFSSGNSKLLEYTPGQATNGGSWSTIHSIDGLICGNTYSMVVEGNILYIYSGLPGGSAVLTKYDGSSISDSVISDCQNAMSASLTSANGLIYIAYTNSGDSKLQCISWDGSSFAVVDNNITYSPGYVEASVYGDTLFISSMSVGSKNINLKGLHISSSSPLPANTIMLNIPDSTYSDASIWVDGVQCVGTVDGNKISTTVASAGAKTAVMYSYNANNIPVGMTVWKLTWSDTGVCTAMELAGLKDLLSYHGFSIRVQGVSGLRFKSGINETVKSNLINSSVDGYHLVEYGTLVMNDANRTSYPFVLGGMKVSSGQAYWSENGVINDRVFETVSGRIRFTSVFTNVPSDYYDVSFAFRAYIILEDSSGNRITIYGPPVAKSIYTIAKQIIARNDFPVGSAGYNYITAIIEVVEN